MTWPTPPVPLDCNDAAQAGFRPPWLACLLAILLDRIPAQLSVPSKWHPYRPPSSRPAGMPGHERPPTIPLNRNDAANRASGPPGVRASLRSVLDGDACNERSRPARQKLRDLVIFVNFKY